ncbi:MAG: ATP-binding protein [Gammaproteobacteria bacterium]
MWRRLRLAVSASLRTKLLLLVLFPILVFMPVILGLAAYWTQQFAYTQLSRRVNTDLAVAHDAFSRIQQDHLAQLKYLGESYTFRTALTRSDAATLRNQVAVLRETGGFDFLHLTDPEGHWLYTAHDRGHRLSRTSPLQRKAIRTGSGSAGVEVFSRSDLEREDASLVDRATLDGSQADPGDRVRGLVLRMVYPVKDRHGAVIALLDGGILLNHNFDFVDAIRDLVYGPGSVPKSGWGAVSVFLAGSRVSTNLPRPGGESGRALGGAAPQAVLDHVMGQGKKWIARFSVGSDRYMSAFEPIEDDSGQRVGMLSTAYLEEPVQAAYLRALGWLGVVSLLSMVFAAAVAFRGAGSIFRPIEAMAAVVRAQQDGQPRRIGPLASNDEIGALARQFDTMLDLLDERHRELERAAEQLEEKVADRTCELQEKNARLEETIQLLHQTRRQLVTAEKLAAIGELTAGVAHEINNPVAVILGNMEVIISELGEQTGPIETEITLIMEQIARIRVIVDQLLSYARPGEYAGGVEEVDVNAMVDNTLVLVRHEFKDKHIDVKTDLRATRPVRIVAQELQQVLVNLLVNAAHAIDSEGTIDIDTADWEGDAVVIRVTDNGRGIQPEHLNRIFDPFYTTDQTHGTGLGLSVSYGLVQRYGGHIGVHSRPGEGTCFEVFLYQEPSLRDAEVGSDVRGQIVQS